MHSYFCLLNLGNLSARRSRTVCKSSIYITSVRVPLWSNHLSWVRIRCETPQLWSQLRVCCGLFMCETAVLWGVRHWCVDLNVGARFWADSVLLRPYSSDVKVLGVGEKLDACKFDSVLCKMATFLCLIALCRVMIVSETLSFIKWVWATVYKKHLHDRLHFQGMQTIILY